MSDETRESGFQDPIRSRISPDGLIRVDLCPEEWFSSQWVFSPKVIDVAQDRVILDLWGTEWDSGVTFPGPGLVELHLRRYSVRGTFSVAIDLRRDVFRIALPDEAGGLQPEAALAELARDLDFASLRAAAAKLRHDEYSSKPGSTCGTSNPSPR